MNPDVMSQKGSQLVGFVCSEVDDLGRGCDLFPEVVDVKISDCFARDMSTCLRKETHPRCVKYLSAQTLRRIVHIPAL